ncbi:MAG: dTMP kinase [Gammaproteobacteria bacterium]|nr:dTMP kinase [Gammaproteobacteria bacterium]
MKGLFISFEGTDGSGKTSVIKEVERYLKVNGYDVVITREPGGVSISEQVRNVIHDTHNTDMDAMCEALLYAAARRQHLVQKVIPLLNEGKVVLCDRYVDSSLAYQGYARGLGIDKIKGINDFATDGIYPDLTIFIKVRPEVGIERIMAHTNTHELNRLDRESLDFHKRTFEGYLKLTEMFPERIKPVDGERSIKEVALDCFKLIKEKL